MRGDFEQARESIREGQGVLEDFGWGRRGRGLRQMAATVELLAGDLGAAERELRQGCEVLERIGEAGILSTTAAASGAWLLIIPMTSMSLSYLKLAEIAFTR